VGDAARERVRSDFLSSRSMLDHLSVVGGARVKTAMHAAPALRTLT